MIKKKVSKEELKRFWIFINGYVVKNISPNVIEVITKEGGNVVIKQTKEK